MSITTNINPDQVALLSEAMIMRYYACLEACLEVYNTTDTSQRVAWLRSA